MSWILEEATRCDSRKDRIILENPKAVKELDDLLLSRFYPFILSELKKTKYRFIPLPDDVKITSIWSGGDLGRALVFMLFDDLNYSFFRGTFSCTKNGFFLEREFFLGLPQNTNPSFMFRILSEDRFAGNPPSLRIESSSIYPEWNTFFYITLNAGKGFEYKGWTLHNVAKEHIETTIHDSIAMYEESMIDGFSTMDDVDRFLRIAYRCFEAE